jgi:probable HAF family extracellular repeat protein
MRRICRALAGLVGTALAAPVIVLGPAAHAAVTETCPTVTDHWEAVDLGFLGIPRDINNAGDIVGETRPWLERSRPFLIHDGARTELPSPAGVYDDSSAWGVDEAGTVAGESAVTSPTFHESALVWHGAQLLDLGTLGGKSAFVEDIGGGTVVGQVSIDSSAGEYGTSYRAVTWRDGQVTRLPTNSRSVATGANETGQVVGTYKQPEKSGSWSLRTDRGFVWEYGVLTDLGTLGGNWSAAYGNNDLGEVVGTSVQTSYGIEPKPFVWSRGTGLRPLVGTGYGQAEDINNHGVVVGNLNCSTYGPGGPAVWPGTDRQAEFLPVLADHPDWYAEAAYAVNDANVIVGFVHADNGPRAVLWRPKAPLSTGTVVGTVSVAGGGPVSGAKVTLSPGGASTTSSGSGVYAFKDVTYGTYTVTATYGGQSTSTSVTVDTASETVNLTVPAAPPPPPPGPYSVSRLTAPFLAADQTVLPLTGDDKIVQVPLPVPVSLYGQTYSTAWVDTNGKVSFVDPGTTYVEHSALPSAAVPNASVYPFWDDLVVDSSASVRTAQVNGSVVIEWRNVYVYGNGAHNRITFSVAFAPDGTITMYYAGLDSAVERGNGATVGVENATGTVATQFSYNRASLASGTAVRFTP